MMSERKGLFGSLFGGKKEKKGCCNMEIVEVEETQCDCDDSCCAAKKSETDH